MSTKLKIDLSLGLLEVEGSEAFVRAIYADFKTHFAGVEEPETPPKRTRKTRTPRRKNVEKPAEQNQPTQTKKEEPAPPPPVEVSPVAPTSDNDVTRPPKTRMTSATYMFLGDLDLGGGKDNPSLIDFMDSKLPITNEEHNIVFLYYLQHMLKIKSIKIDHLYTAYRAARIRTPLNIENTLDQRGWIKVAKNGNLTLSATGKKYVEQNLPKKMKS